jgi:hypothetical protein
LRAQEALLPFSRKQLMQPRSQRSVTAQELESKKDKEKEARRFPWLLSYLDKKATR